MTEPSDEELERAERIRKLRSGGARSRSHERRERRWDQKEPVEREPPDDDDPADDGPADDDPAEGTTDDDPADAGSGDGGDGGDDALAEVDTDVVALAEELPEDGSLFVVPVRRDLRREFNKVAEQLHLQYGFEFGVELDAERHVRPLALHLGIETLEDADAEDVRELLASVDTLDAPDHGE